MIGTDGVLTPAVSWYKISYTNMKTIKTAVSLPEDLYLRAEKMRKKLGKSRSKLMAEGLTKIVRELEIKDMEGRDNAAYLKNPHTEEEIAEIMAGNADIFNRLAEEEGEVDWRKYFPTL
jgi:metal-responsive CopG/Arc/MetJ family transcriptional regulator